MNPRRCAGSGADRPSAVCSPFLYWILLTLALRDTPEEKDGGVDHVSESSDATLDLAS